MSTWYERSDDLDPKRDEGVSGRQDTRAGKKEVQPATAPARSRRNIGPVVEVAVGVLAILVVVGLMTAPRLGSMARGWWDSMGGGYAAAPFFEKSSFAGVRKGMTPAEVRELIGNPLERHLKGTTEQWHYTVPEGTGPCRYPLYVVSFDRETRRVLDARKAVVHAYGEWRLFPLQLSYALRELRVETEQGSPRSLRPGDAAYLVRSRRTVSDDGCTGVIRVTLQQVAGAQVLAEESYVLPETSDRTVSLPPAFVWRDSRAYPLPQPTGQGEADQSDEAEADAVWLLRRLSAR